ncbi:MAG: hypothetical protein HYV90_01120 [Candidatus Woesebacteria bacterium]|nr:MAG: hypothetical protein HYV90_01120 [Candidatus Woesebacteria bacterium]
MAQDIIKELKEEIDDVFVLNEVLHKINGNTEHIDIQVNNLVILGSALFAFSATGYISGGPTIHYYLLVLALFSSLSAVTGLLALNPPGFLDKRGQKDSKLYTHGIAGYKFQEDYYEAIKTMLADKEKTVEQYALEIYNLSKFSYLPKRKLFNLSKNLLIVGFLLSFILFAFQIK